MFMVAVTRQALKNSSLQRFKANMATFPPFVVTFWHDGFYSEFLPNTDGLTLRCGLLGPDRSAEGSILCSVKTMNGRHVLSISNPTILGRTLFFFTNEDGDFFCSSRIGLLRMAGVRLQENPDVIPEFMVYRCVTPPASLYKNIQILPPGGTIELDIHHSCGIRVQSPRLPNYAISDKQPLTQETIKQVEGLLRSGIDNLSHHAPLYFLLSGGLDSSILFAIGKKQLGVKDSYSASYPFECLSTKREEEYAHSAASAFGAASHHYCSSNEEYLLAFIESIANAEQPVNHLQSVMLYLLFKHKMDKRNGVVVCGYGADSIFGLRTQRQILNFTRRHALYRFLRQPVVVKLMRALADLSGKGKSRIDFIEKTRRIHSAYDDPDNIIWDFEKYGSVEWVCDYYGVNKEKIIQNRLNILKPMLTASVFDILSILGLAIDSSVTPGIWASLAESTGNLFYLPYLNEALMVSSFRIQWEDKLRQPKYILRKIARNMHVPEFIITRKKSGFGANPSLWAPKGSLFEPLVGLCTGVFPEAEIRKFQSGEISQAMTYWNMLNYALWKKIVLNGESVEDLQGDVRDRMHFIDRQKSPT